MAPPQPNEGEKEPRLFWVLFPYASALVVGPTCLVLGWNWIGAAVTLSGALIILRCFWLRAFVTLPLLALNVAELALAMLLIVLDLRERLPG